MTDSTMLHVRIDNKTKEAAAETLAAMGMSMSQAVRLVLHRVVADEKFPLELKIPNAATREPMAEAHEIILAGKSRFLTADELFEDLEKNLAR